MSPRPLPPLPDARPHATGSLLDGWRCTACGHPLAFRGPWCPKCRSTLEPAQFGPSGTVWSSTVFRVPLPGRTPPWVLAWVNVDDGPRVLAHVDGPVERLAVGDRVQIIGESDEGDLLVKKDES